MRRIIKIFLFILPAFFHFTSSCKKEHSCEGCREVNLPPVAIAGPDLVIVLLIDSVLLDGSASHDPDGTISSFLWTRIYGSSAAINTAAAAQTIVKNLATGVYQFELKVTDDKGLSARDTVQVSVTDPGQANRPPVANAGPDQVITLPVNTVTLDGSGSTDPDNNIVSYLWQKISGPPSFSITNSNAIQTLAGYLSEGIYLFELTVTDAGGLFSKDTVRITVNAAQTQVIVCDTSRPTINATLTYVGVLSQFRTEISVATAGNKILFAGGISSGNNSESSRVDIFDISANTWSTAELSLARVWMGSVSAGNKIYFAGGQNSGDSYSNVDIYDVTTNSWSVSYLNNIADGLAAASTGDKVLFAGGNWGTYATNTADIFDPGSNTWTTAFLSSPRNFISGVSYNDKVYFSGGYQNNWKTSDVIDIYDNTTGTWSSKRLLVSRCFHGTFAINGKIFFAGGFSGSVISELQPLCSVEILDVNTGDITLNDLFAPGAWSNMGGSNIVIKDNKLIFLRGGGGVLANRFDIYDTQTNTWSIGVLPQPVPDGASFISANNEIYIAGGLVNGILSNQVWKLEF